MPTSPTSRAKLILLRRRTTISSTRLSFSRTPLSPRRPTPTSRLTSRAETSILRRSLSRWPATTKLLHSIRGKSSKCTSFPSHLALFRSGGGARVRMISHSVYLSECRANKCTRASVVTSLSSYASSSPFSFSAALSSFASSSAFSFSSLAAAAIVSSVSSGIDQR